MTKKKSKKQSSDAPINNGDSSDSVSKGKTCAHADKAVDSNQVNKSLKNIDSSKKNFCPICLKENKRLQANDLFVCLRCGTRTCGKEHSLAHFNIPHSDVHCLAYDFTSQELWCYYCKTKIDETEVNNGKLNSCLMSLNRQLSALSSKQKTSNSKINEPSKESKDDENAQPAVTNETNGKRGKHNGRNVYSAVQSSLPVRGLKNLGNTCYFNSVMQCLARTELFLEELKEMDHQTDLRLELNGGETLEGSLEKWDSMTECLHETLKVLLAPGPTLVPCRFLEMVRKKHPQFEGHDQHDAHELLRHTLDTIKMNDLRRYRKLMLIKMGLTGKVNPKEVADDVPKQLKELEHKVTQVQTFIPEKTFKGRLVSRVECQECHHSSECIEGFLDLSLPILPYKPHPPCARSKASSASPASPVQESKPMLLSAKELRRQRNLERKNKPVSSGGATAQPQSHNVDEVAVDALDVPKCDDIIGVGHEEDDDDEEKPHESGYSSEKVASSSLRGSPSSEEVRSTSPCGSWTNLNQFNDSWFNLLQEGGQLPSQPPTVNDSFVKSRLPMRLPLLEDGTPDMTCLSLLDSNGATINSLCRNTDAIMQLEPDWRSRIHQIYFADSTKEEVASESVGGSEESAPVSSALPISPSDSTSTGITFDIGNGCTDVKNNGLVNGEVSRDGQSLSIAAEHEEPSSSPTTAKDEFEPNHQRAATPPLRKSKWPLANHDFRFPMLKEEDADSVTGVSPFSSLIQDCKKVEPLSEGSSETELADKDSALASKSAEESANLAHDSEVVDCQSDQQDDLSDTSCVDSAEFSFCSKIRCRKHNRDTEKLTLSDLASHISTMCFSSPVTDKPTGTQLLGDGQAVPNNSLESDCNESLDEKSLYSQVCPEDHPSKAEPQPLEAFGDPYLQNDDERIASNTPFKSVLDSDSPLSPNIDRNGTSQLHNPAAIGDLSQSVDEKSPQKYHNDELNLSPINQSLSSSNLDGKESPKIGPPGEQIEENSVGVDAGKSQPEMYFGPESSYLPPTSSSINRSPSSVEKSPAIPLPAPASESNQSWLVLRSPPAKKKEEPVESNQYSVESCLQQFTSIELMTGSNLVGCSTCTERQNKGAKDGKTVLRMATKQLLIGQAPPVLILHLKRFQVQLHSVRKLNKHVTFPLVLDLAPFCSSIGDSNAKPSNDLPMYYSLYGIVEHRGTLNSGHYVAYVKAGDGEKPRWFCISDSHVDEVTEERVLKTPAYLLFYSRLPVGKIDACNDLSAAATPP